MVENLKQTSFMKYGILIDFKGTRRLWFFGNKTHREDGPAIERVYNGKVNNSWVLKGNFMQEKEFNLIKENKYKTNWFYE
jgi:hypothetical protein